MDMAGISGWDSSSLGMLFSSVGTRNQNNANSLFSSAAGNFGIDLNTYSSIRSGSYYKLVKSYYSMDEDGNLPSAGKTFAGTSTSKDSSKTLANVENAAEALKDTASELYRTGGEVFKKKTITDEEGNTRTDYDKDAIYKKVSQFVKDYNSLVSASGKASASSIASTAASMVNYTSANASSLEKLGISIDSENYTLSIDAEKFKSADMEKVKSLFQGTGSYAYGVASKASMIDYYAQNEAAKSNTYTSSGNYTYNYKTGEIYNTQL